MLCLGIDPDLHDLAIAAWDDGGPVAAHVVRVPKRTGVKGGDAVMEMFLALTEPMPLHNFKLDVINGAWPKAYAVEAQELRRGGNSWHKRPEDVVHLANVAGMAVMRLAATYPGAIAYFPKPAEWKGSVPKHAMQARLYEELTWGYKIHGTGAGAYAVPIQRPESFRGLTDAQWKHVGDALLLARWCWRAERERVTVRA